MGEHSITKERHTTPVKDKWIKLNRNELAGAFGDLGTFVPLITGVIVVSGMSPVSTLLTFGIFCIFSGLVFGVPMPVQPMKAVATLAITEKVNPEIVVGAGLFIGAFFLFSTITGFLDWVERITPKSVVRGSDVHAFKPSVSWISIADRNLALSALKLGYSHSWNDYRLAPFQKQKGAGGLCGSVAWNVHIDS